jgi:hypothetical protein
VWRISPPVPQVSVHGDDFFAHDGGGADEFLDGGPLGGQSDEQPADLGVGGLSGHDVQKDFAGLVAGQVLAPAEFQQCLANAGHVHSKTEAPAVAVVTNTFGCRSNLAV